MASDPYGGPDDCAPLNWYGQYPFQAQLLGTFDVFQSMGVMQIKWSPDGIASPGTESLRWKSTAFNLDYYGAKVRYYYDDGLCDWCTGSYGPRQQWASIGAWYQPTPWRTGSQQHARPRQGRALAGPAH